MSSGYKYRLQIFSLSQSFRFGKRCLVLVLPSPRLSVVKRLLCILHFDILGIHPGTSHGMVTV